METKQCSKCGRELPATTEFFFAHPKTKLKISSACKECRGCEFRKPYSTGVTDPKTQKRCHICGRVLPRTLEYFQPGVKVNGKQYFRSGCRECNSLKYAAKKGKGEVVTNIQYGMICDYFENKCAYCGCKSARTRKDYIIPLSKGGRAVKLNCVPACWSCIKSKGEQDTLKWFRSRAFFTEEKLQKILDMKEYFKET